MFETVQRHPDLVMIGQHRAVSESDGVYRLGDITVRTLEQHDRLSISVTALETPVRKIRLRWHARNRMKGQVLGDAWERSYADLGWQNLTPWKNLPWYTLITSGTETAGYGVMVRPAAICSWQLDPEGISLWLDMRCGGEGVELMGRTLNAAEVVFRSYDSIQPFEAARQFCQVMCTDPLLPDAPVYGANNWYYAYGHSSHSDVLEDARYLARLTRGVPNRPFFVIDDGWQQERYRPDGSYDDSYNGGPWLPNPRFGDMKLLAREISDAGVLPGIWVRLLQDRNPDIPASWLLPHTGGLDPSIPEVLEYISGVVDRIGQWGYHLLKHDFSTVDVMNRWGFEMPCDMAADGWHFADRSRTSAEIIMDLYRTILRAGEKHGMLIMGCNAVGHLGAGLMHLQRIGDDTSGLMWERTLRFGVNTLAFRLPQHRTFFDVDADCLGISSRIPWAYNRQWGTLLSLSGTSLFYSVKPDSLPYDQEQELSQMLRDNSVPHPPAMPLDWMDSPLPQEWDLDGKKHSFSWYEPGGLRVACANGPEWGRVWQEISAELES